MDATPNYNGVNKINEQIQINFVYIIYMIETPPTPSLAFFTSPVVNNYTDITTPSYKMEPDEEIGFINNLVEILETNPEYLDLITNNPRDKNDIIEGVQSTRYVTESFDVKLKPNFTIPSTLKPKLKEIFKDLYVNASTTSSTAAHDTSLAESAPYTGNTPTSVTVGAQSTAESSGGFRKTNKRRNNKGRKRSKGTRKK
jgi:hypothetical protein